MLNVCAPLLIGLASPESTSLGILAWVGISLWLFGVLFEATGDLPVLHLHLVEQGTYTPKRINMPGTHEKRGCSL